jgi:hypothetical protein
VYLHTKCRLCGAVGLIFIDGKGIPQPSIDCSGFMQDPDELLHKCSIDAYGILDKNGYIILTEKDCELIQWLSKHSTITEDDLILNWQSIKAYCEKQSLDLQEFVSTELISLINEGYPLNYIFGKEQE